MILWYLFRTFFLIGAFSFGGGYASMELIRTQVVTQYQWLTNTEFTDMVSIAEMTPGPLGINIASFVGTRTAGIAGTVVATMAYVLPALFLVLILSHFYYKCREQRGMQGVLCALRPAVAAMVLAAALKLCITAFWGDAVEWTFQSINWIAVAIALVLFLLLQRKKLGPIQAILLSGGVGGLLYALLGIAP